MHRIANEILVLEVADIGAEAWALYLGQDSNHSLLWDGGPVWPRRAPVCAPWCGRIRDGYFIEAGRHYQAGLHGLVRDMKHVMTVHTPTSVQLRAEHTGAALESWPWRFDTETVHRLEGNRVVTEASVTNRDTRPMPLQIGFHTGLRCPFDPGRRVEDYLLRFECCEHAKEALCEGGFLTGELRPVFTGQDTVAMTRDMFDRDSILLTGLTSRWVQLEERDTGRFLRVGIEGYPAVLLWSAEGVPGFVCIEPWQGMPGRAICEHTLWERPETRCLAPGETAQAVQVLTVSL